MVWEVPLPLDDILSVLGGYTVICHINGNPVVFIGLSEMIMMTVINVPHEMV